MRQKTKNSLVANIRFGFPPDAKTSRLKPFVYSAELQPIDVEKRRHLPPVHYVIGDVVMIRSEGNPDLRKYDGRWAIALAVNEYTVSVAIDDKEMGEEPKFLEPVEEKYWDEIKQINLRIIRLQQCDLDPLAHNILDFLLRRTSFSRFQVDMVSTMEQEYGLEKD